MTMIWLFHVKNSRLFMCQEEGGGFEVVCGFVLLSSDLCMDSFFFPLSIWRDLLLCRYVPTY